MPWLYFRVVLWCLAQIGDVQHFVPFHHSVTVLDCHWERERAISWCCIPGYIVLMKSEQRVRGSGQLIDYLIVSPACLHFLFQGGVEFTMPNVILPYNNMWLQTFPLILMDMQLGLQYLLRFCLNMWSLICYSVGLSTTDSGAGHSRITTLVQRYTTAFA
jgi:hypothetical protein